MGTCLQITYKELKLSKIKEMVEKFGSFVDYL